MKVRNFVSFLAFGVIIVLALSYIGSLGVRIGPPSNRTAVSMTVADINGLVVGSNVLLRGVPIGQVSGIASSIDGATIEFYFDDRYRIPVHSDVRLDNLSALGESYIGLIPNSETGPFLEDGQHIATESIKQPASISELATSVVRALNQLDPGQLKRIIDETDIALPNPNTVLPNLAYASKVLRNTAVGMNGRGQAVLDNFQTLLRNADWVGPALAEISSHVPSMGRSFQAILLLLVHGFVGRGTPETLINFRLFLTRIQTLLDDRGPDIKVLFEALLPHFQGIAGALMNFDTSQILSNILATVPEDGAITLHVTIPGG